MRRSSGPKTRRVVVGVDGTANSRSALRDAALEAVQRKAVVDVVYAVGRDERDQCSLPDAVEHGHVLLETMVAAVHETRRTLRTTRHVVVGEPARVLVRLADCAELLVIGARNDPEHRNAPHGSTVRQVLHASPCEVLVRADHSTTTAVQEDQMLKRPVVADVMTKAVVTVQPAASYKQIVETLTEHRISGLPVIDASGGVVGVVSEADLLYKEEFASPHQQSRRPTMRHKVARTKAAGDTASELMTAPAVTVAPHLKVGEAARILTRHGLKRLPVVDARNRLVGIVSRTDLLTVFLRDDDEIRDEIVDEVFTRNLWEDPARIYVGVSDGVVTLRGRLEIDTLVPIAVDLTASVPGVVDVVNELTFSRKAADQALSSRSPDIWAW